TPELVPSSQLLVPTSYSRSRLSPRPVTANRARFERCLRAASSSGIPFVQSLVLTQLSALIDVVSAIRRNFFPILKLGTSAFGFEALIFKLYFGVSSLVRI